MRKIYLCGPYSHPDPTVRAIRFHKLNEKAAELLRAGNFVFSPISHSHPIAEQCELPKDWNFWREWGSSFIPWCDEMNILMLDGWETSVGVQAEMEIANMLGKPVYMIEE